MLYEQRALKYFLVALYIFVLSPLVVTVLVSFSPTVVFRIPWQDFSIRWYESFFETEPFRRSLFFVSLPVAICAAFLASLLGTLASVALVRSDGATRNALELLLMAPLFVPSILLGTSLYILFASFGQSGTFYSQALGHSLIAVPYVIRSVSSAMLNLDPRLEEAAISLGCTPRQAFLRVTLPLIKSAIISGAIFAFIVSFTDINLALFLSGPETTTLPIHIFSQIVWDSDPTIAAAAAIQIALVALLIILVQRAFHARLSL